MNNKILLASCVAILLTTSGCGGRKYKAVKLSSLAAQEQVASLEQVAGDRVFFPYDSSTLTDDAVVTLSKQATWLANNPSVRFTIEGHCDNRGTADYNRGLGERRAQAAALYLIQKGIDSSRFDVVSFGKDRPAVIGNDESAWSQNRRVVITIK